MKTIVLVHGAWMNGDSWALWVARYRARGYEVLAPSWPYDNRSAADLRASPDPALAGVGVDEIVAHYEGIVRGLHEKPYLVGHSFGGLFVQKLLDRGLAKAAVAIHPAPPKGVLPSFDAIRAGFPVVSTWGFGSKIIPMSPADFFWGWVHTMPVDQQKAAYERYVVPTPGKVYSEGLGAPFTEKMAVNFANDTRGPLLIMAGGQDRTVSASMNRDNFKKYAGSKAVTEFKEYPDRTHATCFQEGWEQVADDALAWLESKA